MLTSLRTLYIYIDLYSPLGQITKTTENNIDDAVRGQKVQNISHVQHVVQINTKLIQSYKHIRLTILYIIVGLPVSYKTEFFTILQ